MKYIRFIYNTLRSILFSLILLSIGLFMLVYILISVPYFQNKINQIVCSELSKKINSEVKIEKLEIFPFNQVMISNLSVLDENGEKCINAKKIGAGFDLTKLLFKQEIIITFAEIKSLDVKAYQKDKNSPLNLQFIFDAFKSKDKNKPPTKFDLMIQTIVVRDCSFSFDKLWMPRKKENVFDINHLYFKNIKLDASLPMIKNDNFKINLRSLAFEERSGLKVDNISLKAYITNKSIDISNLAINLPSSIIKTNDLNLSFKDFNDIIPSIKRSNFDIILSDNSINLSDLKFIDPIFKNFDFPFLLNLEVIGNISKFKIPQLELFSNNEKILNIIGSIENIDNPKDLNIELTNLKIYLSNNFLLSHIQDFIKIPDNLLSIISKINNIDIEGAGTYNYNTINYTGFINSNIGNIKLDSQVRFPQKDNIAINGVVDVENLDLAVLTDNDKLGLASLYTDADVIIRGKDISGICKADISYIDFNGHRFEDIHLYATNQNNNFEATLDISDDIISLSSELKGSLNDLNKNLIANINVDYIYPAELGFLTNYPGSSLSGNISTELSALNLNNLTGFIDISSFNFKTKEKDLNISKLYVSSYESDNNRTTTIESDFLNGEIIGEYSLKNIPYFFSNILAQTIPALKNLVKTNNQIGKDYIDFNLTLENNNELVDYFNLPVKFLVPIEIKGSANLLNNLADLNISVPYIQQGKDKLIKRTNIKALLNGNDKTSELELSTNFPSKNGYVNLSIGAKGNENDIVSDIRWKFDRKERFEGDVKLSTFLTELKKGEIPEIKIDVNPTKFYVSDLDWNISKANIEYFDNTININGLRVWNKDQSVELNGAASPLDRDSLTISLSNFDLDYLFETLRINHVTFGGRAFGEVKATSLLSSQPKAFTKYLFVRDLSYNDAVMGDSAILTSQWDNKEKLVKIGADIYEKNKFVANVDGGVWVTRDSLSFDMNTDKVNIEFLRPFMEAFASNLSGRASGFVKLYGTFSDIDLIGKVYADTISMTIDYTNVTYSGKDSVYITPGRIEIPSFRLYDIYGNSGIMSGVVTHKYFHDPKFEFNLSNANSLLAYDTNSKMNPDWYGRVFVNGNGIVRGVTGMVNIFVDVSTAKGSDFTYVLSDMEAAQEYTFLSFSDKRKELIQVEEIDTIPQIEKDFQKKMEEENSSPSQFAIDIRASINQNAKINIIMDPRAGDKITATGNGAMQMSYNSNSDYLSMYGRYTINSGTYNFTLQDLIIKNFKIREGSYISFNGDPLSANLDISALYRVNTNLADLDKSFSYDRDLNRTNVPVDAVLNVKGGMQNPEITFDIELPTLTQDVERKVKSIISTDDMLSRQVLYLLALNRFYTPEYMSGQSSNGTGEFASVASSTISSQISSMLGHLSDNWQIAPSFRSDKGDFSDTEFDLALSSRLLNNRLLINGNFGYRDKSTSQTTFIGDFDLEYLLSKNGNLRLKAYNHFNDQNYYLKSSLTTQGIGIIYRREFDNPFSWIRRKKRDKEDEGKKAEKGNKNNNVTKKNN